MDRWRQTRLDSIKDVNVREEVDIGGDVMEATEVKVLYWIVLLRE